MTDCFKHNLPILQIICDEEFCDGCVTEYLKDLEKMPLSSAIARRGKFGWITGKHENEKVWSYLPDDTPLS